jgi:hypothetical protein
MTNCTCCGQDREAATSCSQTTIVLHNLHLFRIRYGEERPRTGKGDHCAACGTPRGGFHHAGCTLEQCPHCFGQLADCRCQRSASFQPPAEDPVESGAGAAAAPQSASLEQLVILETPPPSRLTAWRRRLGFGRPAAGSPPDSPGIQQLLVLVSIAVLAAVGLWLYQQAQQQAVHELRPPRVRTGFARPAAPLGTAEGLWVCGCVGVWVKF